MDTSRKVTLVCCVVGRLILFIPVVLLWVVFSIIFVLCWGLFGLVRRVLWARAVSLG